MDQSPKNTNSFSRSESQQVVAQPYEYFKAQVLFAHKISEITGDPIEKCMIEYTDLYNSITDKLYGDDEIKGNFSPIWIEYVSMIQKVGLERLLKITYDLFLQQPHSQTVINSNIKEKLRFGCFSINYSEYNKEREQIRLHFTPTRSDLLKSTNKSQHGDLSSNYFELRQNEFSEMVQYIYKNRSEFEGAKYLKSSTWLQNIPNYQKLFPAKYLAPENRTKKENSFLGLWGQFTKWDLTGNSEVLLQFEKSLAKTKTLEEAINSFPYPVYEIKVPLDELFEMYLNHKSSML